MQGRVKNMAMTTGNKINNLVLWNKNGYSIVANGTWNNATITITYPNGNIFEVNNQNVKGYVRRWLEDHNLI